MKLISITRDKTFVAFEQEVKGSIGNDTESRETHEAPLKTFDKAMQKLATVVCYILGTGQQWGEEIRVKGLTLSYTQKGTRSAKISFVRTLSATEKEHPMSTPVFQFDEPAEGESDSRQCHAKHAEIIEDMVAEAEKYIKGERQQALLDFEKEKPAKKEKTDPKQGELAGVN